jgi:PqqD family protein of HPr-rel-A system
MTNVQRPLRQGQAWVRRESDDAAVYNPDTGVLHLLNPSALAIWELCDGHTTVTEMIEAVAEVTDATEEVATTDVVATLEYLQEAGLVS